MAHDGSQMPYCSELKVEGEGMKTVESLVTKHVPVKGRRREIVQWLEAEVKGLERCSSSLCFLKHRATVVQRKRKRHDNQMH